MKKALSLSLAVVLTTMLLGVLPGPAELAVAQGPPEDPGRSQNAGPPDARALLGPPLMFDTSGTCSIECSDGSTYETDADSTIECACDCSSVCGETCEATDGEETRTCTAT